MPEKRHKYWKKEKEQLPLRVKPKASISNLGSFFKTIAKLVPCQSK
jgi:hypothetical protein